MSSTTLVRSLLISCAVAAAFALLFLFRYDAVSTITLIEPPSLISNTPIGEIVQGFSAEQLFTVKLAEDGSDKLDKNPLCVEVLLANYANRSNTGQLDIELILDSQEYVRHVEAASVADNVMRRTCFNDVAVGMLRRARESRLILRGVSSPPGAAVTAWTTSDVSIGHLVSMPSSEQPRSLVVGFSAQSNSDLKTRNAIMLIVLSALAVATAFWTNPYSVREPDQQPSQSRHPADNPSRMRKRGG